jgi:hypothetical protein
VKVDKSVDKSCPLEADTRAHDVWLPDSARQQVRQINKKIQVRWTNSASMPGPIRDGDVSFYTSPISPTEKTGHANGSLI